MSNYSYYFGTESGVITISLSLVETKFKMEYKSTIRNKQIVLNGFTKKITNTITNLYTTTMLIGSDQVNLEYMDSYGNRDSSLSFKLIKLDDNVKFDSTNEEYEQRLLDKSTIINIDNTYNTILLPSYNIQMKEFSKPYFMTLKPE